MRAELATSPKTIKIWERGQLTIPKEVREDLDLNDFTMVNIFRIGKNIIITPKKLLRANLARKVQKAARKEKTTLKDLLSDLEKERERYNRENYRI